MLPGRKSKDAASGDMPIPKVPNVPQGEFLQERLFVLSVMSKGLLLSGLGNVLLVGTLMTYESNHRPTPIMVDMTSGKPVLLTSSGTASVGGVDVNEAQVKAFTTRFLESRFNYNWLTYAKDMQDAGSLMSEKARGVMLKQLDSAKVGDYIVANQVNVKISIGDAVWTITPKAGNQIVVAVTGSYTLTNITQYKAQPLVRQMSFELTLDKVAPTLANPLGFEISSPPKEII